MKNAKCFWRLLGYFLIPAIFFAFGGGSLRAQTEYTRVTSLANLEPGTYVFLSNVKSNGFHLFVMTESNGNSTKPQYKGVVVHETTGTTDAAQEGLYQDPETFAGITPLEVEIAKDGDDYTFHTSDGYLCWKGASVNSSKNLAAQSDAYYWTISGEDIKPKGQSSVYLRGTYNSATSIVFSCYANNTTGSPVTLYKKKVAPTCNPVTNKQANVEPTKVTLTWNAPDPAPANGYKVTITPKAGGDAVVTDAAVAAGTTTYTHENLTAGTDYTYSIVSDCGGNSTSNAVTGEFSTPAADAKSLNVSMSGAMEGDKYTTAQPIVFTFTTTNFTLGSDGKVKYSITGNSDDYTDVEDVLTQEGTLSLTFPASYYFATFELVDHDRNSLAPPVRVEKEFTVKLPKLAAPEFSLAEQAEAFTTAQTITLTAPTGASCYYAIDEGEFAAYPQDGIVLDETGTFKVHAYAAKDGMENSDTLTKTYTLKIRPIPTGVKVHSADFTKATASALPTGWTKDGSGQASGDEFYVGSGSKTGSLSMTMDALLADFTIFIEAKGYKAGETKVKVSATVEAKTIDTTISDLPTDGYDAYLLPFSFASAKAGKAQIIKDVKISVATAEAGKRFYLKTVEIYQATETPEECAPVTLIPDGSVTPKATGAEISWRAPDKLPANGYKVTVKEKEGSYNQTQPVSKEETHIEWTGLSPETEYTCSIVSVCGDDDESDPVETSFKTPAASAPNLDIVTPAKDNYVFTGDVTFTFTTENFELGENKLVKVEVKEPKETTEEQLAAPVLKRLYTKTSPVTISGLEDGKYHVDLYLANVTENEGKKDTTAVDLGHYVHRNIEVKHPAVYFAPKALKINTFLGVEGTGKVMVTGWALPENATISLASDNDKVTVMPNSLTQAEVMAEGGAELTVKYNGADASATATITATCGDITATLAVNAIAKDTLSNLKAVYGRAEKDTVLVKGKMVVTHKDSAKNCRVWVQDIEKENGASMLLYGVTAADYKELAVGDVLENVAGKVTLYSETLYELTLNEKLVATEHGHAVYVDTLSLDEVKANNTNAKAQSALVCIKDVQFKGTGNFESGKSYTLQQGEKELTFRTDYAKADYIGKPISASRLYVTAIVGSYKGAAQVTARSLADMVQAPCLVPENITVEPHSNEAEFAWEGLADNYSLRYAKAEADLASATAVAVAGRTYHLENLDAATTYYYQIKSVCGADGYESEWSAVKSFTTMAAGTPSIRMTSPVNEPKFTDSVLVTFTVKNVTLKTADTSARIVFSDGFTFVTTDTAYKRALPSGNYSVRVELIKNNDTLTPSVRTLSRKFSVDLPDVAEPVFTPVAGRYADSVEVTLDCATQGAAIFYAQGEGEFVAYTAGEKIVIKETAELKAFACKERMDTSAVVPASYVITKSVPIEGELVFEEYFDKVAAGTGQITDKLDENTTLPGWTGALVYQHTGGGVVRVGKSISNGTGSGWIETPAINLSENNGKFMVSFYAQAWKNDKDTIRVVVGDQSVIIPELVNDKETNQKAVTDMTHYVVTFENGTVESKIKFEAHSTTTNNRFFLDSIRVYQVLPNVPRLSASPAMFEMNTVQGTPASQKVTVKGNLLESDVTVNLLQTNQNFSASATTLAKNDVMSENGAELTVTFNASVAEDSVKIELTSGELSQTVKVRAYATQVVEVDNIAALRAGEQNTLYKVKGEVVVTAVDGISTWVQDATAAIQIYGNPGNTYAVGDGITGIYGTLSDYHGLIELVPGGTQPAATTHDKVMDPEVMTVEELNEKGAEYSSRLIRINGLNLNEAEGNWKGGNSYPATDEAGNELVIYTTISHGSYIGEALPTGKFDLIAIAGIRDGKIQVTPRVKEDIIAAGGDVDECDAPTGLTVSGSTKITVKWNGSANEYKLVLLSKDGKDTVFTKMLTATQYTFGNEVKPNVEYGWAVASVCADGSLKWAKGNNFQVETANEDAELQADVYPNPTDGVVYIRLVESARMEIFTLGGVVIRSEMLNAGRNELRLDQSGIYFIRLSNGSAVTVKRIVVR